MTLCQLILREMTLMACFIETKYKICDKNDTYLLWHKICNNYYRK